MFTSERDRSSDVNCLDPPILIAPASQLREKAGGTCLLPQEHGPRLHERSPPLEQVRAPVGRLDAFRVHVGQRQLAHLPRRVRTLRHPVPEARPEPVRHHPDLQLADKLRESLRRRARHRAAKGTPAPSRPQEPAPCGVRRAPTWRNKAPGSAGVTRTAATTVRRSSMSAPATGFGGAAQPTVSASMTSRTGRCSPAVRTRPLTN